MMKHKCIRVNSDGDMVIMTHVDGQVSTSRRVTHLDWVNHVVPAFVAAGAVRVAVSKDGDQEWME